MRKLRSRPRKSAKLSPNAKIEDRLTHTSMLLAYLFENGVDFQKRTINITGEIDEETFNTVDAALSAMEADGKSSITVKVNSPGGEVYQAMAIVGRLRESKCHIVTKGYGAIMSAATLILACGDKRFVSKYSWFMNHEASYGVEGARHSEVKALVEQSEKEEAAWCEWMAEFTKKNAAFWKKSGTGKDAYYSAQELVELGVVDEVF